MDKKIIDKYDNRLPRYTSYPTSPHFEKNFSIDLYEKALKKQDFEELSLYVHIPFCKSMCSFCACHSYVAKNKEQLEEYISYLTKEISLVGKKLGKKKISHIHFGGGSPSILEKKDFDKIMNSLKNNFSFASGCEFAVELDPRNITNDLAKSLKDIGVNRVSLGIQDFNEDVQKAINRIQPKDKVLEKINLLKDNGINKCNFDMVYGLPSQTLQGLQKSLKDAVEFSPDRFAIFGYAHVPWVKPHQKILEKHHIPDIYQRWEQYEYMQKFFVENGYNPIGLDHFTKENDELLKAFKEKKLRRNFQGYTTDDKDVLIGFGASAIGYIKNNYYANAVKLKDYYKLLDKDILPISRGKISTKEDVVRKKIIMELMCYLETKIDEDKFANQAKKLKELVLDDIIEYQKGFIRVKEKARPLVRAVCSVFDEYYNISDVKHSKSV